MADQDLLKLPPFIQSKDQVHELIKEVLMIEDFLYKGRVRESGSKMSLPKTTAELDSFAQANNRNVLQHAQRRELAEFLRNVYKNAPEVAVQFERPDKQLLEGVVEWFRNNIHAQTLIRSTYNPRVGVGCYLRIKHKTYDLTLKSRLAGLNHTSSVGVKEPAATSERARLY